MYNLFFMLAYAEEYNQGAEELEKGEAQRNCKLKVLFLVSGVGLVGFVILMIIAYAE